MTYIDLELQYGNSVIHEFQLTLTFSWHWPNFITTFNLPQPSVDIDPFFIVVLSTAGSYATVLNIGFHILNVSG